MLRVTFGDTAEVIVTVYGANYLHLGIDENVKEVETDVEVKDDSKELKQEVKGSRGEMQLEAEGTKDNVQPAEAARPSK